MKTAIRLCIFLILNVLAASAQELIVENAPPAVVDRVALAVTTGDYAGIAQVSAEIDHQFKGVHDVEYFRNLLGILAGLRRDKSEFTFERRWAIRKLQWKILLTKHSRSEDAVAILKMKDRMTFAGFATDGLTCFADADQFVALRLDAAALLWSYRDSLQRSIIPNYQAKPEIGSLSVLVPNTAEGAKKAAEVERTQAALRQNQNDNWEQVSLGRSLRMLDSGASNLILQDFSWPPQDDATVTKLLETFPPNGYSLKNLLLELELTRKRHLKEYPGLKEKAVAALLRAK